MSDLLAHRGPDDAGTWTHERGHVGFGHRRLSIFDLSPAGHGPMKDDAERWLTYNGEVYNHPELRAELGGAWRSGTDTEVVMRAHDRWGAGAVDRMRGMFAYALWDEPAQELLCVRDRFGIKPFYYAQVGDVLYFASEPKALLPFLPAIETDVEGLKDYLAFQFCLAGKTLFKGVRELLPGHFLRVRNGVAQATRYWEVYYDLDFDHTAKYYEERIEALLAVVAPGIAEALLATALGLVAAIPAVVIYNVFARWIAAYRARLADAAAAVERLVSRDLDHRRLAPATLAQAAE